MSDLGIKPAKLLNIRLDTLPTAMVVCNSWAGLIRWTLGSIYFGLGWTGFTRVKCADFQMLNLNSDIYTQTRPMQIYAYLSKSLFKKGIQYKWKLHPLKFFTYWRKNCPYKMIIDGFCFLGFQNFPGEDPRPPRLGNVIYFSIQHCSTQALG